MDGVVDIQVSPVLAWTAQFFEQKKGGLLWKTQRISTSMGLNVKVNGAFDSWNTGLSGEYQIMTLCQGFVGQKRTCLNSTILHEKMLEKGSILCGFSGFALQRWGFTYHNQIWLDARCHCASSAYFYLAWIEKTAKQCVLACSAHSKKRQKWE